MTEIDLPSCVTLYP